MIFSDVALWQLPCSLMRVIADIGGRPTDAVDLYNGATRAWSTARLSVARTNLAAASVGNVSLFAGEGINEQSRKICSWLKGRTLGNAEVCA